MILYIGDNAVGRREGRCCREGGRELVPVDRSVRRTIMQAVIIRTIVTMSWVPAGGVTKMEGGVRILWWTNTALLVNSVYV